MGVLPDRSPAGFELFARRWLTPLLTVFLRSVRDPALAYDLSTETLATARLRWESAPTEDEAISWLLRLGESVLDTTVERGRVPAVERHRGRSPDARRLGIAEQQEIMALTEAHIELPTAARDIADALARSAPPRHVLRDLQLSGLVQAEPLPDRERDNRAT